MTCPTCHGAAHIRGAACFACYGAGETCDEVAPAVVSARLSVRAEFYDQMAAAARGRAHEPAACVREAALLRLAQVEVLGRADLQPTIRDVAALRGVQGAIAGGCDVEAYVVALTRWVSPRGLVLVLQAVRASCDVVVEARIRGVVHG